MIGSMTFHRAHKILSKNTKILYYKKTKSEIIMLIKKSSYLLLFPLIIILYPIIFGIVFLLLSCH